MVPQKLDNPQLNQLVRTCLSERARITANQKKKDTCRVTRSESDGSQVQTTQLFDHCRKQGALRESGGWVAHQMRGVRAGETLRQDDNILDSAVSCSGSKHMGNGEPTTSSHRHPGTFETRFVFFLNCFMLVLPIPASRNPKARLRTVVRLVCFSEKNDVTVWDPEPSPARSASLISLVSDPACVCVFFEHVLVGF